MRIRPVQLALIASCGASILALTACGDKAPTDEPTADAASAEASATPDATSTDLVVEPAGPKVDVNLPETPMTNTPAEAAKAP